MIGESIVWTGVFLASVHILNSVSPLYPSWFGYTMIVSPLFTTYILTNVYLTSNHNLTLDLRNPTTRKTNEQKISRTQRL